MSAKEQLRHQLQQQLTTGQTAAKWMPREKSAKSSIARELMQFFGMSPKFYRQSLADLSETVEQKMCAKDWDNINFSHVPSVASARYKKAFNRNTVKFAEYVAKLVTDDATVKISAGAVFPYDVLKGINSYSNNYGKTELDHIVAQWNALPNYVGEANILPMVDVSGSMCCPAGKSGTTTCMDVAVSLGLYLADKNQGKFKDTFLTFSSKPELLHLKGNVVEKMNQMVRSHWEMSTNLHAAFNKILDVAVKGEVPQSEMPEMVLILSDMQFNQCVEHDDTAMQMIERKYAAAGYEVPHVVFWNLNASGNVPVSAHKSGAALVSGFSPSIVKAVLAADPNSFTPDSIMRSTVCIPRYDY